MTSLGAAALALAGKGMRVFPCDERSKKPALHDNLKRATTDTNVIAGWWRKREFNIGIATGASSGIWVLDVDGEEGEATLRELEDAHGPLPATVEAITGKGRHLYWRWSAGIEIRNAQLREDVPGLDWRGDGGYVMAPPSVHPNGRRYTWSVDSADKFADAPEWLIDLVTSKSRANGGPGEAASPESWRTFIGETVDGSRRGQAIVRLSGLLLRRFLDPMVVLDLARMFNTLRCRPLLEDEVVIKIVTDIANLEKQRRERLP